MMNRSEDEIGKVVRILGWNGLKEPAQVGGVMGLGGLEMGRLLCTEK